MPKNVQTEMELNPIPGILVPDVQAPNKDP